MTTLSALTWVSVRRGSIALTSRPRIRVLRELAREEACTHVLTLLSEREGAAEIGAATEAAGMAWMWLPFENGSPPGKKRDEELTNALAELRRVLGTEGSRILIHCSAGIHRTGMVAYALLRFAGDDAVTAREKLAALRTVTHEGVGEHRIAWGEELVARVRGKRVESEPVLRLQRCLDRAARGRRERDAEDHDLGDVS